METREEEEFAGRSVVITGAAGGIGIGFTRSLAKVVGEHGITVNAVRTRPSSPDRSSTSMAALSFTKAAANEGTTNSHMKTLVIGGAGLVGSAVVKELGKRGADVRVFARNKSAVMDADKDAVEVAEGDLLDPATVEKALDGVDKLYLLNAVAPDELTQGLIAYDLARKHRLQHVVYHSVFRAEHFLDVPHFASKVAIENALKAFDIRMMMKGYLERGFTAGADDLETLTALIGHPPRRYEGFVRETAAKWDKDLP
jgi:NAD(P)-dependent dehydrogenase (short-subunit alcohol dehydrogenase family)